MVEIFMLGIIVAAIKLHKMAALVPELAAWAFMLLVLSFAMLAATVEPRLLWKRLEAAK